MFKFSTKKTGKIITNTIKEALEIMVNAGLGDNATVYDLNDNEIIGNCTFAYFKTQA